MPPKLSVIVPVYNEENHVREIVQRIRAVSIDKEIVIVDDGSTDGTRAALKSLEGNPDIRIILHDRNQGKGRAIRTALEAASGDVLIIQDADMEYDPKDYLPIMEQFKDPDVHVVYGTRFSNVNRFLFPWHWFCNRFLGGNYEIRYLHHFVGIQGLNVIANVLYGANITDEATCYKAFRRDVLKKFQLKCQGFEFCPEVTAKVRKAGYRITEVPISYKPRSTKQGKKLNWWKHGFEALYTLIKYRFVD